MSPRAREGQVWLDLHGRVALILESRSPDSCTFTMHAVLILDDGSRDSWDEGSAGWESYRGLSRLL